MKRIISCTLVIMCLFALCACGRPDENTNISDGTEQTQELKGLLLDKIESIEISGYYDGSVINEGDFVIEDFDEFVSWFSQLSLEHRTFAEGKTPGEMYAGWNSYIFDINDGELTFTYNDGGTITYIIYNEEWYELSEPVEPPFSNR